MEQQQKNPEMLRYILDHLKTKKMCKNAVKKLPFIIRCVSDQYKTQEMCEMCDTIILQNAGTLMFISDCYKSQKICNKAHWQLYPFIRVCPWLNKKNVQ